MAATRRILRINDLDPKGYRRKKRRRLQKGDYLRISKATTKSSLLVTQQLGLKEANVRYDELTPDIKADIRQSTPNLHKL